MRGILVALASVLAAGAAMAGTTHPVLDAVKGDWKIVSASGVFIGSRGRVTIEDTRIVGTQPFPTSIVGVASVDNMIFIKTERGMMLLRQESADRLCGWGVLGPMVDMRTELTRSNPPFCLVRMQDRKWRQPE